MANSRVCTRCRLACRHWRRVSYCHCTSPSLCACYQPGSEFSTCLIIDLGRDEVIRGLKVWNYNESLEDTWTGVKHIRIVVDGQLMTPMDGVLVRKAPGTATFDFGQFVPLQAASAGDGVATDAGSNRDGGHHKANGRSDGGRVSRLERGASMPSHITHGSRQVAAVVSPSHAASHKRQMSQSLGYGAANASLARGIVAAASQAAAELRNRASRSHRADNHDDDAPSGGDPSPGGHYSFSDQAPRNDTDDGAVKSASPVSPLGEAGRFAQFSLAGSKGRGTAATAAVAVPAPSAPLSGVHMDYSDSDSSDDGMDVAPTSFTRALLLLCWGVVQPRCIV